MDKDKLKQENPKEYKKKFYSNGIPRVDGKSYKQYKSDQKANYKPTILPYKTDTSHITPHKKALDWAGDVGRAHQRNQKGPGGQGKAEKGYREDYR